MTDKNCSTSSREIGLRIKEQRKQMNLSQTDIKALTGIGCGNLSLIENGSVFPSATALLKLSDVFQCSIDYILRGKEFTATTNTFTLTPSSKKLLIDLEKLPPDEQEEVYEIFFDIVKTKLRKYAKKKNALSSPTAENKVVGA